MNWRDQLQPASFRGVRFHVEGRNGTTGRRHVIHEYPKADHVYAEDMGLETRSFSVTAYIVGPAYMDGRDALIAACDEPGPGLYIDPYLGERLVVCDPSSYSENRDGGGFVTFELSFVVAEPNLYPAVTVATDSLVQSAADDVWEEGLTAFEERYLFNAPVTFFDDYISGFGIVGRTIGDVEAHAHFFGILDDIADTALSVLRAASPGARLHSMFQALRSSSRSLDTAKGLLRLIGQWTAIAPSHGLSRRSQLRAGDEAALLNFIIAGGLAETSYALSSYEFASYDEALGVRLHLSSVFDAAIDRTSDQGQVELSRSLQSLMAKTVNDLIARGQPLARITSYNMPVRLPSVVLAHKLYYDASRAEEIEDMNDPVHPSFVPEDISILSH